MIDTQIANTEHLIYKKIKTDIVSISELEIAIYEYPSSISVQKRGVEYFIRKYMSNDAQFFSQSPPKNINSTLVSKQRNQEWLSKLTEANRNYENTFVAVGTGHLVDERNNLIDTLTQRTVEKPLLF